MYKMATHPPLKDEIVLCYKRFKRTYNHETKLPLESYIFCDKENKIETEYIVLEEHKGLQLF